MNWLSELQHPTMRERIKPFWFWNGDLSEKEIDRQLREMKEQGIGGAFICARQGQKVPYLGKKWDERVKYACQRAKEYGLEVWLYDEYPYPSGVAGGEVLLEHPEAVHTMLNHQSLDWFGGSEKEWVFEFEKILYAQAIRKREDGSLDWNDTIDLKEFIGNRQETEIYQYSGLTAYNNKRFFSYGPKKVLNITLPTGEWKIELYTQRYVDDFKYYGTYFDPCNKEAVQTFIETTYARYDRVLGEEFGKSVLGMFSDETGMLGKLPWSVKLPDYFKKRNGYDICEVLPALHHVDWENSYKIRYDYYQSVHELLRDSYHKQISKWCQEHGILYATEVPSMRRSTESFSHVVGGDTSHEKVGRSLDWVLDRYLSNYRSCAPGISSLARQLGRDYAMVESFHSVGWSMTLQDAKWMFDLMAAQGINFFNVHAFYYTIDSITKHDAPPSQFFQNPYWKDYHLLADYAGRLSAWVSNTEAEHMVAILDPVVSLWTRLGNPMHGFHYVGECEREKEELDVLRNDWIYLAKELFHSHVGYDFLDGEIMERAEIRDGKMYLGKAVYSVLVIPPVTSMEKAVTDKLEEFVKSGGYVIGTGLLPDEVVDSDVQVRERYKALFGREGKDEKENYWKENGSHVKELTEYGRCAFVSTEGTLKDAQAAGKIISWIQEVIGEQVIIDGGKNREVYSSVRRQKDGGITVFVGNHGRESAMVTVAVSGEGRFVGKINLETGKLEHVSQGKREGETEREAVCLSLDGCESCLLLWEEDLEIADVSEHMEVLDKPLTLLDVSKEMPMKLKGQNVYRLYHFEMSLDQREWTGTEVSTFIEACDAGKLLNREHIRYSGAFGLPKRIQINYPINVYYRTSVLVEKVPENVSVLMDDRTICGSFVMKVNGHEIRRKDFHSYFVNDQNNILCPIASYMKEGDNRIEILVTVEQDFGGIRDTIYLIGDFGVEKGQIGDLPKYGALGFGYVKGIPYYSGEITFTTKFTNRDGNRQDTVIALAGISDFYESLEIRVNGHSLGTRVFTPYRFLCKKEWMQEENTVELIYRNTLIHMLEGSYFDYQNHRTLRGE